MRPRRRSASTSSVFVPARASVAARPNATVVLPWLPSGLVTTTLRVASSANRRFVRRSRIASATILRRGWLARSSGECSFRMAVSAGTSA